MDAQDIQQLCDLGQDQLSRMQYLQAEQTLANAENLAWKAGDWDALSRLYMPLQESRRQRRQRCGEGIIRLDFLSNSSSDQPDGAKSIRSANHGSALIAGWGSIAPAIDARRAQKELELYADVFLAAVYPIGAGRVVAIIPREEVQLPPVEAMSIDQLIRRLPAHSIVLNDADWAATRTFAEIMALWERLHAPFLAAADATIDPIRKIAAYRQTIRVDYACELAHQRISDTARALCAGVTS